MDKKKFVRETIGDYHGGRSSEHDLYNIDIPRAITAMISSAEVSGVTPEQIGVIKMLRIAMDGQEWRKKAEANGRKTTYYDYLREVAKPVIKL